MNCPKCNASIIEGDLICQSCGYQYALNKQREDLEQAKANVKGLIIKRFHSPLFVMLALCFVCMFAGITASLLAGEFFVYLLPFIFSFVATIGLLGGCFAGKRTNVSRVLRRASVYDAYQIFLLTIALIISIVGTVILFILLLADNGIFSGSINLDNLTTIATAIVIIIVGGTIGIWLLSLIKSIHKNRRKYFLALSKTVKAGEYTETKVPVVGSCIIGILTLISGLCLVAMCLADLSLIDLYSFLVPGEFGNMIKELAGGTTTSSLLFSLGQVTFGLYYIFSAVWMYKVHKEEIANKAAIEAASTTLPQLEDETRIAMWHQARAMQYAAQMSPMMYPAPMKRGYGAPMRRPCGAPAQKAPTAPAQKAPAAPAQKAPTAPAQKAPAAPAQKAPVAAAQKAPAIPKQAGKAPATNNASKQKSGK